MQVGITSNVFIRKVNGNNGECIEKSMHNLVTRRMIVGLMQYIGGEFVGKNSDSQKSYLPIYLQCGESEDVTTFEMTSLVSPFFGVARVTRQSKEVLLDSSNMLGKVSFRFYLDSNYLKPNSGDTTIIKEIGMFSTSEGNSMVARINLDEPLEKGEDDFIDVLWEVNFKVPSLSALSESEGE